MKNLLNNFTNAITYKEINANEYQIISKASYEDGTAYEVFLMQDSTGKKILTDKKHTMKYMDEYYDLDSKDVKSSINSILNIYGFKIFQKALVCRLKENDDVVDMYFRFIACIAELSNMFVFFDSPKEDDYE